jgi:hypothetical protein
MKKISLVMVSLLLSANAFASSVCVVNGGKSVTVYCDGKKTERRVPKSVDEAWGMVTTTLQGLAVQGYEIKSQSEAVDGMTWTLVKN